MWPWLGHKRSSWEKGRCCHLLNLSTRSCIQKSCDGHTWLDFVEPDQNTFNFCSEAVSTAANFYYYYFFLMETPAFKALPLQELWKWHHTVLVRPLQQGIAALLLLCATGPQEKCKHTQLINPNIICTVTLIKIATTVSTVPIHQLLKLLEESSQTSVVTQLDLSENNAILQQGRLSPWRLWVCFARKKH